MPYVIELPDGNEAEFPDGTPLESIKSALQRYRTKSPTAPTTATPMSVGERFAYGAGSTARGLAQLARKATEAAIPPSIRSALELPGEGVTPQSLAAREADYQARKPEGPDYAAMAGEIAATLPLAILGGPGGAVAGGALAGAAQPTAEDESYWAEKGKQAALGAAGSVIGAGAGKALGTIFRGAANAPARALMAEGVTPTLFQSIGPRAARLEEKLTSIPVLGAQIVRGQEAALESANVAAYNRALAPIGAKSGGRVGPEGIAEVHQTLSRAYDELAPKLTVGAEQLGQDVAPVIEKAADYLPAPEQAEFQRILGGAIRRIQTEGFKGAESYLTTFATKAARATDPDKLVLGDMLDDLLDAARDSLAKQNPQYAGRLRAINQGWANYAVLRDAAFGAERAGRDVFTPAELSSAVARSAARRGVAGRAAFTERRAPMQDLSAEMLQVLGKRYPDSGTAGRLAIPLALGAGGAAAYAGGWRPGLPEAAGVGVAMLPYASPTLRRAAAAMILKRPAGAELAGRMAAVIGRGAAPGTGLALAQAGAAAAAEPDEFWNQRTAGGVLP